MTTKIPVVKHNPALVNHVIDVRANRKTEDDEPTYSAYCRGHSSCLCKSPLEAAGRVALKLKLGPGNYGDLPPRTEGITIGLCSPQVWFVFLAQWEPEPARASLTATQGSLREEAAR